VSHLALFAHDTYIYKTENHENLILCKLQRGLIVVKSWYERWNIKIIGGKILKPFISPEYLRVSDDVLQLNGRGILFVNNLLVSGVSCGRKNDMETPHRRDCNQSFVRTYIRTYSLLGALQSSDWVSYVLCLSHYGLRGERSPLKIAMSTEQSALRYGKS
jgi:hypothetical protein